jgi:tetratricopeptide (TPR) repeat protein
MKRTITRCLLRNVKLNNNFKNAFIRQRKRYYGTSYSLDEYKPSHPFISSLMEECKPLIKSTFDDASDSVINTVALRYQMLFNVIHSCLHLAAETKTTYKNDPHRWLTHYQYLFVELSEPYHPVSWTKEMARISRVNPTSLDEFKHATQLVLSYIARQQDIHVINNRKVDGAIVARFAQIVLDCEVFRDNDNWHDNAEAFSSHLTDTNDNHDYYIIEKLSKSISRAYRLINIIDDLPNSPAEWKEKHESLTEISTDIQKSIQEFINEEELLPVFYVVRKRLLLLLHNVTHDHSSEIQNVCTTIIQSFHLNKDYRAYADRASALTEQRRFDEAVQDCEQVLNINPYYPYIYFKLISLELIKGKYINAAALLEEFSYAAQYPLSGIYINPEILNLMKTQCLAICYREIKDPELYWIVSALVECRSLLLLATNLSSTDAKSTIQSLLNDCEEKIIELYPENTELACSLLHIKLTYAIQVAHDFQYVGTHIERMVELSQNHPAILSFAGSVWYHLYMLSGAREVILKNKGIQCYQQALQISNQKSMPDYRFDPYRTRAYLEAIGLLERSPQDEQHIQLLSDSLKDLEKEKRTIMSEPVLLMSRASYLGRCTDMQLSALHDLDKVLKIDPFNTKAISQRIALLNILGIQQKTLQADKSVLAILTTPQPSPWYNGEAPAQSNE